MKKACTTLLTMILCITLLLSLTACGGDKPAESTPDSGESTTTTTSGEAGGDTTTTSGEDVGGDTTAEVTGSTTEGGNGTTTAKPTPGKTSKTSATTKYVPPADESGYTAPPSYKTIKTDAGTVIPKIDTVKGKTLRLLCVHYAQFEDGGTANQYMKKYYGIQVKETMATQETMKDEIAKSILSDKPFDLVASDTQIFPELVAQGVMEPVDNCIDYSTPAMAKLKTAYEAHAFHGKHYTIPWVVGASAVLFYNIEMFEDAYLDLDGDGKKGDTPYSMYEKGTWTFDNFLKAAKEMTVTDKTGKVMTYGLASRAWTDHQLMYLTGESIVKESGGKLVSNLDSSNFQRIYNDYVSLILDSKVVSRGGDADTYGVFDKGSAAMLLAPSHCASGNYFSKIWKSQNVGIAPMPKDSKSSTYYVPGTAVSFYILLGGFEAKDSGKVNRDLLNAFIHATLASENEKSNPDSEAYKKTRDEFVAKWSKENKKFTNAWYDEWSEIQRSIGVSGGKVTPYVDPYNASMDVNGAILEKMLGLTCPAPITFSAAVNEAVGVLNTVLATVND